MTPKECSSRAADCIRTSAGSQYMLSGGCEIPAEVTDDVFEAFCRATETV